MIVRTPNSNAAYNIYNLGQNQMLASATPFRDIGDNWNFAGPAGVGSVYWDFDQNTIDVFMSRPDPTHMMNDFLVYNIRGNQITSPQAFFWVRLVRSGRFRVRLLRSAYLWPSRHDDDQCERRYRNVPAL